MGKMLLSKDTSLFTTEVNREYSKRRWHDPKQEVAREGKVHALFDNG